MKDNPVVYVVMRFDTEWRSYWPCEVFYQEADAKAWIAKKTLPYDYEIVRIQTK